MERELTKEETQITKLTYDEPSVLLTTKERKIGTMRYFSPIRLANMKNNYYPGFSRGVENSLSLTLLMKELLSLVLKAFRKYIIFDLTIPLL
jgi:hypothetical protein